MPHPTNPRYQVWADRIAELIGEEANPLLVGHSFGASVLLKYLAEAAPRPSFAGLFMIATPFWGPDLPESLLLDFESRFRDVSPLYFYHSRDDAEVPFEHLDRYSSPPLRLLCALWMASGGHEFNQTEFPELVDDIRSCARPERTV